MDLMSTNGSRRITTTAKSADSRHTRIIPAIDQTLFDELQQFTFAHHGIGKIQTVELDLSRTIVVILLEQVDEIVI